MHPKTSTTSLCLSRADTGNAYKKYILLKNDFSQKLLGRFFSYFGDLVSHAYFLNIHFPNKSKLIPKKFIFSWFIPTYEL